MQEQTTTGVRASGCVHASGFLGRGLVVHELSLVQALELLWTFNTDRNPSTFPQW